MSKKTNAVRLVEQAGIPCSEAFYDYDPEDLNGMHAALALSLPAEQVYKTLVLRGSKRGVLVFCVPVCADLDLKKAAKCAGEKSVEMVHVKDLLALTGYIRGGCSPVGMKKRYPTYIDMRCKNFDFIAVSAGERGHQMLLSPLALSNLISAEFADIIL